MKHAYLILAHSEKGILKELIQALDDARNDIYIHLDVKAKFDISDLSTNYSGLYIYFPINWMLDGAISVW